MAARAEVVWITNACALEKIVIIEFLREEAKCRLRIEVFGPAGDVVFLQGELVFPW